MTDTVRILKLSELILKPWYSVRVGCFHTAGYKRILFQNPQHQKEKETRPQRFLSPLSQPKVNLTKPRKLLNPELSNET